MAAKAKEVKDRPVMEQRQEFRGFVSGLVNGLAKIVNGAPDEGLAPDAAGVSAVHDALEEIGHKRDEFAHSDPTSAELLQYARSLAQQVKAGGDKAFLQGAVRSTLDHIEWLGKHDRQ